MEFEKNNQIILIQIEKLVEILRGVINEKNEIEQKDIKKVEEVLLKRKEAAEYLKISLPTLHRRVKSGIITPVYIGNSIRFKKSELEKF